MSISEVTTEILKTIGLDCMGENCKSCPEEYPERCINNHIPVIERALKDMRDTAKGIENEKS